MSYLEFDRAQLINVKYSLGKEYLRTNKAGTFASSTIMNCHTRKYHGLLITPLEYLDGGNHVLVSAIDETIIQRDAQFHMAVRKYPGKIHGGHKYFQDFVTDPVPALTFHVGGVTLRKEMILAQDKVQVMIKYTLEEATSPTLLRLHPFLAFRNIHTLSKANMDVSNRFELVANGIKTRMYDAYPYLYMQLSKKAEYISAPDWFYNVEYAKEKDRGYDCLEDLFVPGFFEFEIKKGESVYLSLSLSEEATEKLKTDFAAEIKKRTPRTNFENCLINSANQFFVRKPTGTELIAGYPWFSKRLRNTLAALPGLTLQSNNKTDFKKTLDTITADLKAYYTEGQPLKFQDACFADSKLWYAFTLQHYLHFSSEEEVYKKYLPVLKLILNKFKTNSCPNIHMAENGLIHADSTGHPLTWMDTISNNMPVTKRPGYVVEVNALWYNAIAFAVNLSEKFGDTKFVSTWKPIEEQVKNSFIEVFTDENHKGLADFVYQNHKDFTIRPNQIIAASLEFSPLNIYQCNDLLEEVKQNLLTDKGLRTLPPNHLNYHGNCAGSASDKEQAYHQGTAWPWLSGHFAAAYLKIHGKGGLSFVRTMYAKFEEEMKLHGIGTISEMFDADPPHKGRGAISYAWSVAEILRIKFLADNLEKQ